MKSESRIDLETGNIIHVTKKSGHDVTIIIYRRRLQITRTNIST